METSGLIGNRFEMFVRFFTFNVLVPVLRCLCYPSFSAGVLRAI